VVALSDRWITQSEKLLKAMEELSSKKGRDRLEIVNSMILALNTLDRSIHGWRSWVQSLRLMSKFTEEDLREMEEGLMRRIRAFVEYDIEVTKRHREKLPRITVSRGRREEGSETGRGIYV
jgi:hypothetical protein